MARSHSPKPLYGSRKVANDAIPCRIKGCNNDALVGYNKPPSYRWYCNEHRSSNTSAVNPLLVKLRSMGLIH